MIKLPDSDEPLRILALDPGSSHLGVAYIHDYLDSRPLEMFHAYTVHLKDNAPMYTHLSDVHDNRTIRLMQLGDAVLDVCRTFRPHVIIVESNYLGRFPTAFAALVECVAMVRSSVYMYDPFLPLYQVDPSTVKINAGIQRVKGTDKEDVRKALHARTHIRWTVDLDSLDEHAVDACAIGLYCAENVTPKVTPLNPVRKLKIKKKPRRPKGKRGKRK